MYTFLHVDDIGIFTIHAFNINKQQTILPVIPHVGEDYAFHDTKVR